MFKEVEMIIVIIKKLEQLLIWEKEIKALKEDTKDLNTLWIIDLKEIQEKL